jgi:hypothetical protein
VKHVSALLSLLTILCLDLILLLGAVAPDAQSIRPYFNALVAAMDVSLVSSSGLLALFFVRHQSRPFRRSPSWLEQAGRMDCRGPVLTASERKSDSRGAGRSRPVSGWAAGP